MSLYMYIMHVYCYKETYITGRSSDIWCCFWCKCWTQGCSNLKVKEKLAFTIFLRHSIKLNLNKPQISHLQIYLVCFTKIFSISAKTQKAQIYLDIYTCIQSCRIKLRQQRMLILASTTSMSISGKCGTPLEQFCEGKRVYHIGSSTEGNKFNIFYPV